MMRRAWFPTDNGEMLIEYDTANGDVEKRKANFIEAAAKAEIEAGCTFLLNDEGRRRVDELKVEIQKKQKQASLFDYEVDQE